MLTWLSVVNFLDKIVLGLVAVPLMAELRLSAQQFGLVASAFFWLFSVSTIGVGFLANHIPTRWLLLGMGVLWAKLQFPMAFNDQALPNTPAADASPGRPRRATVAQASHSGLPVAGWRSTS